MFRDRRFARAIVLAMIAHGLGLLIAGLARRADDESSSVASRTLDVSLLSIEEQGHAPQSSPHLDLTLRDSAAAWSGRRRTRDYGPAPSAVPNRVASDSHLAAPDNAASAQGAAAAQSAAPSPRRPTITREQLGLGAGNYAALLPEASPVKADMQARLGQSRKLSHSIQQDAVEQAGKLGLSEEGPIVAKLEQLAQRSPVDLTGFATISARVLENGTLDFELLGTSSDRSAWSRLLARAKKELLAQRLKVPRGSRGIDLEIRIESRIQMPSGADPGIGVKLFGRPLKKGEGKRSSTVELLSSLPRLVIDPNEKDPALRQRLEVDVFKFPFDLADLSGKRSRVTSARVVRRTLL